MWILDNIVDVTSTSMRRSDGYLNSWSGWGRVTSHPLHGGKFIRGDTVRTT